MALPVVSYDAFLKYFGEMEVGAFRLDMTLKTNDTGFMN